MESKNIFNPPCIFQETYQFSVPYVMEERKQFLQQQFCSKKQLQ